MQTGKAKYFKILPCLLISHTQVSSDHIFSLIIDLDQFMCSSVSVVQFLNRFLYISQISLREKWVRRLLDLKGYTPFAKNCFYKKIDSCRWI